MQTYHDEWAEALFDAVMSLRDKDECRRFFDDLCTARELHELSQRLEIARQLSQGKNYLEIAGGTHVSTATISRVNKCLRAGSGGYRDVLGK